ncbi:MAG TPA: integrase core domain-containing protein [Bacteroidales bacterium]|nr:integrase core domain-containing protein [Bacteroidales bacterium]HOK74790.1 integrase core domain-containing protein [Bacteroidales bacterium]HOM41695.1 integrase core domain-containing protein [Bacteroidales bacterium]HRT47923.1 integrase core domain-containing protein [Bacteroidales bacterium]
MAKGIRVADVTRIAGMKKSTYYYKPNGRSKGKRPSTHTLYLGNPVSNRVVVDEIMKLIDPEYHDYGYQILTDLLRQKGYKINYKKVYRLMDENNLLHPPTKKSTSLNKTFIRYSVPPLEGPFRTIEADIKYVYIHEENRNAFLVTFLCTFCRYAPVWDLQYKMKSKDIAELVYDLLNDPDVKRYREEQKIKIMIRTDNGPQIIAKTLAGILESLGVAHEFIQPGTPQQNAHIESFHSTVTRLVCKRNILQDLEHAREIFKGFFQAYNETRVMRSLLCHTPKEFLKLWESGTVGIKKNKRNREIFFFREKPHPETGIGSSPEDLYQVNKNNIFESSVLKPLEISPV